MTDYYVDNTIDSEGYFIHLTETVNECDLANGTEISNISGVGGLADGDIVQLYYSGAFHVHRLITGSPPWNVYPAHGQSGTGFEIGYGHNAGTTKTAPFVGINRASVDAGENDTVWIRKPYGYGTRAYNLDGSNQVAEQVPNTALVSCEGTIVENSQVKYRGFHTNIGDMARGGVYHQHVYDAWHRGVNLNCFVEIDGGNNNWNLLYFSAYSDTALVFENFYFHNINATKALIYGVSTMRAIVFKHCIFGDANVVIDCACNHMLFIDCLCLNTMAYVSFNAFHMSGDSNYIMHSIIDIPEFGGAPGKCAIRMGTSTAWSGGGSIGNIIRGGLYPVFVLMGGVVISDNIFYDGLRGVVFSQLTATAFVYNNIFCVHDHGDVNTSCITVLGAGGACIYNDYNCFWSADGQQIDAGKIMATEYVGGFVSVVGPNSVEADPLFRDPANHDFSLDWKSPVIDMGFRNRMGFSSMGATDRKIKRPFVHGNKGVN